MKLTLKHAIAAIVLVFGFAAPVTAGQFEDAAAAYNRGDYPRLADISWITMAKWLCETSDWHLAPRVPGSNADFRRGASPESSDFVRFVL